MATIIRYKNKQIRPQLFKKAWVDADEELTNLVNTINYDRYYAALKRTIENAIKDCNSLDNASVSDIDKAVIESLKWFANSPSAKITTYGGN